MIFEKRYSISAERAAREIVTEKSEKSRKYKKRNRISKILLIVSLVLSIITDEI
jgi:hypothetical protein